MKLHDFDVKYLTFDIFDNLDFIRHCFSTKIGGVSTGHFESLNLGIKSSDNPENIVNNFKLLSKTVGFDYNNIVFSDQVHDTKLYHVKKSNNNIKNIDGLLTKEQNIVLTTFYADCVPLFFVDKVKKIIALSHSGWKGTVNKIGQKTVTEMIKVYNSDPKDILVGIGPSICKDCFEVDEPVYLEFKKAFSYIDDFCIYHKNTNKYFIDMWQINKKMLLEIGLLEKNIEITNYCTKCNHDIFYSHRVTGTKRGSLAAFLELK